MQEDFKSDRINFETTLYKGCTLHELMFLFFLNFIINILLFMILFSLFFHHALIGLAVAIPAGFITALISATTLGNVKQNKPQGYYQQRIVLWLEDKGLTKTPYVRRSGSWSVRRFLK